MQWPACCHGNKHITPLMAGPLRSATTGGNYA